MNNRISFYIIFLMLAFYGFKHVYGQQMFEAFTHPTADLFQRISIYSAPNVHYTEIDSDTEAGWIAQVYERKGNFFRIDIKDLSLNNVWIHCGDLGVNIQNYDSINIPLLSSIVKDKCDTTYINFGCTAIVYDFKDPFVFVRINVSDTSLYGWVEKKYLCGSPYTTCP